MEKAHRTNLIKAQVIVPSVVPLELITASMYPQYSIRGRFALPQRTLTHPENPATAADIGQEKRLFNYFFKTLPSSHKTSVMCQELCNRMCAEAGFPPQSIRTVVYDAIQPNACINVRAREARLSTGLLDCVNYRKDKILVALGHEVGHAVLHEKSPWDNVHPSDQSDILRKNTFAYEQEYQADRFAAIAANRLGIAPELLMEVLDNMEQRWAECAEEDFDNDTDYKKDMAAEMTPYFINSHPYLQRRKVALGRLMRNLPRQKKPKKRIARIAVPHAKDFKSAGMPSSFEVDCHGSIVAHIPVDCIWNEEQKEHHEFVDARKFIAEKFKSDNIADGFSEPMHYLPDQVNAFKDIDGRIMHWYEAAIQLSGNTDGYDDLVTDITQYTPQAAERLLKGLWPVEFLIGHEMPPDPGIAMGDLLAGTNYGVPPELYCVTPLLFRQAFSEKMKTREGLEGILAFLREFRVKKGTYLPYGNGQVLQAAAEIFTRTPEEDREGLAEIFKEYEYELCGGPGAEMNLARSLLNPVNTWLEGHSRPRLFHLSFGPREAWAKNLQELKKQSHPDKEEVQKALRAVPQNYNSDNWTVTGGKFIIDAINDPELKQELREGDPQQNALLMSNEEFEEEYFGKGRGRHKLARYGMLDDHDPLLEIIEACWNNSDYGKRFTMVESGRMRYEFLVETYRCRSAQRDTKIVEALGWKPLRFLSDVSTVQKDIQACTDISLLVSLGESFENPLLRMTASHRLWDLYKADRATFERALPPASREQAQKQLAQVDPSLVTKDLMNMLACYAERSPIRDELLKEYIDGAPDEKNTLALASLLTEPPPTVVQARSTSTVAVSEGLLDALVRMKRLDKEETLLYLMGQRTFYSGIDAEFDALKATSAEARRMLVLYHGNEAAEFLGVFDKIGEWCSHFERDHESCNSEALYEALRSEMRQHKYKPEELSDADEDELSEMLDDEKINVPIVEEPDGVMKLAKIGGIPMDLLISQQKVATTRREQRDLLEYCLIGKGGILETRNSKFLGLVAQSVVSNGTAAKGLSEGEQKGVTDLLAYALKQCPRYKLPDLILDCWNVNSGKKKALPDLVTALMQRYGPVLIKSGQYLATQTTSLPPVWTTAFRRLSDQNANAEKTMLYEHEQLVYGGKSPFRRLGRKVGEGSMAAVYEGELYDGSSVVAKVLHPNIRDQIKDDTRFLHKVVGFINKNKAQYHVTLPGNLAEVTHRHLIQETSLRQEMKNNRELAEVISSEADDVRFRVPAPLRAISNDSFMVLEKASGLPLDMLHGPVSRKFSNAVGMELYRQILSQGVYQADPNRGNFLGNPETSTVDWIDTGHIGRLSYDDRRRLKSLITGVITGSPPSQIAVQMSGLLKGTAREQYSRVPAIASWLEARPQVALSSDGLEQLLHGFIDVCDQNKMLLQPQWVTLLRTLGMSKPLTQDVPPLLLAQKLSPYLQS